MIEDITPDTPQTVTDDTDTQTYSFRYDEPEDQSVGISIIRAVASVSEVDPLSLQPRLYDVVDPDALEKLFNSAPGDLQITFLFGTYKVTVTGQRDIFVRDDTTSSH